MVDVRPTPWNNASQIRVRLLAVWSLWGWTLCHRPMPWLVG